MVKSALSTEHNLPKYNWKPGKLEILHSKRDGHLKECALKIISNWYLENVERLSIELQAEFKDKRDITANSEQMINFGWCHNKGGQYPESKYQKLS